MQHTISADLPDNIAHWIGGELLTSADGRTFDVAEPVSHTVYAQAAAGGPLDIDRAVAAAREAFPAWSRLGNRERARILHRIADAIESRHEQLAHFESYDSGLPLAQAKVPPAAARTHRTDRPVLDTE